MQDALTDFIAALEVRPSNAVLKALLTEAETAVDPGVAVEWLTSAEPSTYDEAMRLSVSGFLLAHDPTAALRWASGGSAPELMAQSRALSAQGSKLDALDRYRRAVSADPELEDAAFAREISPVAQTPGQGNTVVDLHGRPVEAAEVVDWSVSQKDTIHFDDVGGLEDVKKQIRRRIIAPMQKPSLFEKFKRRAGGGVLLYGPPGCGKTMMARATAGEAGAHFYPVEISEILDMYIGESEKRLAAIFETARQRAPSVLFFDEIEALAAKRRYGENDSRASLVSTFLTEMDGFSSTNSGVLVLAASNVPWSVDSAFLRPGRFDRSLFVPPPDKDARRKILELQLDGRPLADDVKLDVIVQKTSGFSGADLSGLVEEACDIAIEESLESNSVEPIRASYLKDALQVRRPSTIDWLSQARNYVKFANESGFYDDVARFLEKHASR